MTAEDEPVGEKREIRPLTDISSDLLIPEVNYIKDRESLVVSDDRQKVDHFL